MKIIASFVSLVCLSSLLQGQSRSFDLLTADVDSIQEAVRARALTYEQLVQLYLNRIESYDKKGPKLNAIIEGNPKAIETARMLDQERREKGLRSPLHGIPIAVKDNIDVVDLPSAGGNVAFKGSFPAHDATVIARLRRAGAIIFIKTNMDELALGSRGLSSLGGQTLNPYNLMHNPGGSSGGTAVAVTAGFAPVGLGTETGLSTRGPAANTGIVGIVPTQGLVSRAGVIPISFTQDRVGVHAKSVRDAALLLTYLKGFDPDDLLTHGSLGRTTAAGYADFEKPPLTGVRIGVLRDLFRKGPEFEEGNKIIDGQVALLRENRASVLDGLTTGLDLISLMPTLRVNSFELQTAFNSYLRRRGARSPVQTFEQFVASGNFLKGTLLEARFEQTMKVDVLEFDREYLSRMETRSMLRKLLIEVMDRHKLIALVYPTKSLPAPKLGAADEGPRDNPISAVTGLPAIVVPAGLTADGLPLGIEFLGRPFDELRLIQTAYAYEQASRRRVLPSTTPRLAGDAFKY